MKLHLFVFSNHFVLIRVEVDLRNIVHSHLRPDQVHIKGHLRVDNYLATVASKWDRLKADTLVKLCLCQQEDK